MLNINIIRLRFHHTRRRLELAPLLMAWSDSEDENEVLQGRYRLGLELDHGTYGTVFKGLDLNDGNAPIVLKRLSMAVRATKEIAFLRQILRLQVPHCAKVFKESVLQGDR